MEDIDEIIEIDTKWLLHFLKEKHLTEHYFKKLYNITDMSKKPKTLEQLIEKNKKLSTNYLLGFRDKSDKYILFYNGNLLKSNVLFAAWYYHPFIFNPDFNRFVDNFEEAYAWRDISNNYLDLKYILSHIIK